MPTTTTTLKFTAGPVLSPSIPRFPPKNVRGYGDSCFRAMCFLERDDQVRMMTFIGHDTTLGIIEKVEGSCRLHASKHPKTHCTDTNLTFLQASNLDCSGKIHFFYNDTECKKKC